MGWRGGSGGSAMARPACTHEERVWGGREGEGEGRRAAAARRGGGVGEECRFSFPVDDCASRGRCCAVLGACWRFTTWMRERVA